MNVLVSGASGFIGKNLMSMEIQDIKFFPLKRHSNRSAIEQIEAVNPESFLHLAAMSSNAECEANIGKAFEANVAYACQMYEEYSRKCPAGHFIFFSTGQVYDFDTDKVIVENSKLAPQNFYAQTKLCAEVALQNLARFRSTKLTIVRLFNTSHKSQDTRFFLPSIYQQMISAPGIDVVLVVGNIDVKRDFSTIQETVGKILNLILGEFGDVGIINFCSGNSYSLRELAVEMGKSLGKVVNFQIEPARVRPEEVQSVYVGSTVVRGSEINVSSFLDSWSMDIR